LSHYLERAASDKLQIRNHERLEARPEAAPRAAYSPRDGAHLAVVLGEQDDDAVRFSETVGAKDDAVVAVAPRCERRFGHG
jgi:hypothetical protein